MNLKNSKLRVKKKIKAKIMQTRSKLVLILLDWEENDEENLDDNLWDDNWDDDDVEEDFSVVLK